MPEAFSYPQYLASKRSVDERARHPGVWQAFIDHLREQSARKGDAQSRGVRDANGEEGGDVDLPETAANCLRVLEIGGGVGDLAIKILSALEDVPLEYTLVDIEKDNLALAEERIQAAAPDADVIPRYRQKDRVSRQQSAGGPPPLNRSGVTRGARHVVHLSKQDVLNIDQNKARSNGGMRSTERFDAVCGQAILDIVPAQTILQKIHHILSDNGAIYLPIHFDGQTRIEPVMDEGMDRRVEEIYHASMRRTRRRPTGETVAYDGSRSGRDLLMHAAEAGLRVADVGASEWVVLPSSMRSQAKTGGAESGYDGEEKYFLSCMLGFIEDELRASKEMDDRERERWITTRRRELDDGALALFVHNLDILLKKTDGRR